MRPSRITATDALPELIPRRGEAMLHPSHFIHGVKLIAVAAMTLGMNPGLTPALVAQRLQDIKRKPMLEPWDLGSGVNMGFVDAYDAVVEGL